MTAFCKNSHTAVLLCGVLHTPFFVCVILPIVLFSQVLYITQTLIGVCFFYFKLDTLYITYNLDTFGCVDSDALFYIV